MKEHRSWRGTIVPIVLVAVVLATSLEMVGGGGDIPTVLGELT
jgi:hypothetical protein